MNTFELDLLNFHGGPIKLDMSAGADDVHWLLDDAQGDFSLVEDQEFRAQLEGTLIGTTIRLKGVIQGKFQYACGRCLEMRPIDLDAEVEFVLMSRPAWDAAYERNDEIELTEEDLDVSFYKGDLIDLRDLIREAVMLELPVFPSCTEEMRSACDAAYEANIGNEALEEIAENKIDLRWSALKNIKLGKDAKKDKN